VHKIITPHVVDILRLFLMTGVLGAAVTASFFAPFLLRYSPVMVTPDPIDPLEVDNPMILSQ
jgi:hypothetical protein